MPRRSRTTHTAHAVPNSALDQYGFTVGGPVRVPKVYNGKDKTFFFFAWEKYHEDQEYPSEKVASVPTAAQRKGDFSDTRDNSNRLITIYDPLTGKADAIGKVDPAAVCRQHHSFRPDQSGGAQDSRALSAARIRFRRDRPPGRTTTTGPTTWPISTSPTSCCASTIMSAPKSGSTRAGRGATSSRSASPNAIPGIGGDHRDGGKLSNGGVIDSVTTLNSGTLLNMRASLSYWRELIGPPDFGFDATQWGWPASTGRTIDQAQSAAQHFRGGRHHARQCVVQYHVRTHHGAEPTAQRRDDPRQADHQSRT